MTDLPRAGDKTAHHFAALDSVQSPLCKLPEPPQRLQEGRLSKPVVWSVKPRLGKET